MNINYGGRCYAARAGRLADSLRYAARFREMWPASWVTRRFWPGGPWRPSPNIYQGAWDDVIRVADERLPIAWQIGEIAAQRAVPVLLEGGFRRWADGNLIPPETS